MSEQIIFRCNDCGYYFRSSDASVRIAEEFYCHHCGKIFGGKISGYSRATAEISAQDKDLRKCNECEGDLSKRMVVMCPECQARDVKIQGTVSSVQ